MFNKRQIIHSVAFEIGALLLFIITFAPFLDHSTVELGALGALFSVLTVLLLYFYNQIFDSLLLKHTGSIKKLARVIYAIVFEASLVFLSLPTIAWWLNINSLDAFVLEAATITLMVIYTFIFHWVADHILPKSYKSITLNELKHIFISWLTSFPPADESLFS